MPHLRIHGKGGKVRYVPAHPQALERINEYLDAAGHREDAAGPLFRPVRDPSTDQLEKSLSPGALYNSVVMKYARSAGLNVGGFCVHSLRATAATNALDHEADIAKVQVWLGHAVVATTRLYDRRKTRPTVRRSRSDSYGDDAPSPTLASVDDDLANTRRLLTGARRRRAGDNS